MVKDRDKTEQRPRAGSVVERIDPLHFLAGCRKRRLNQALSCLFSVDLFECVFCCLLGPLFVLTFAFICVLSLWLLLVKLSVSRLARKTPLRTPLHGKEIISTNPSPKTT